MFLPTVDLCSNKQCDQGTIQTNLNRNISLETPKLSVSNSVSNVHVYPNAAHNPVGTFLCITNDGTFLFNRLRKTEKDPSTNQNVGHARFLF